MNNNPLVSIAVKTYNSSKYVLETLESIKDQSYPNLELIISDDYSIDDTVKVCKKWLDENKDRFTNVQIIVPPCNTGTAANCNRAIKACRGEWYKGIAGDDLLMPDCIENNIKYIEKHPQTQILFSQMIAFVCKKDGTIEEFPFMQELESETINFSLLSPHEQYIALLDDKSYATTYAPTLFAKLDLMSKYPYNEFYKFSEDVPEWIKLTRQGVHIDCMDKITVKYRRGNTITSPSHSFYSPLLWGSKRLYFWNELEGYLREEGLYETYNRKRKELLKIELIECLTKNRPSYFNKMLAILISKFLNCVNYPKF